MVLARRSLGNPGPASKALIRVGLALLAAVVTFVVLRVPENEVWAAVAAGAAVLALLFAVEALPVWREKQRARQLIQEWLTGELKDPGYFRLGPYGPSDRKAYRRPGGAHERVLSWILGASSPLLYLTGRSGTGKSSLLAAHVVPTLGRQKKNPWTCLTVRSYADPLRELVSGLREPGAVWEEGSVPEETAPRSLLERACDHLTGQQVPRRLLVTIDQFEEFVILHSEAERRDLEALLNSLVERPIQGLTMLLIVRSDYIGRMEELGLPRIRGSAADNWIELSAFTEKQGREFLTASGLEIGASLLDDVMREATEIEETEGLVRPITLNLMGTILDRYSGGLPKRFRARSLIDAYLRESVGRHDLEQIAPAILRPMLTHAGIKQPRTVAELENDTGLKEGVVRSCLLRLGNRGLVRCLDEERDVWEISHDFLARRLGAVIARWEMGPWRRIRPWLAPAVLGLWVVMALLVAPFAGEYVVMRRLGALGAEVQRAESGLFHVDVTNLDVDLEALASWLRWVQNPLTLDLSGTEISDADPLRQLTELQHLDLSGTQISDLEPLRQLTQLQHLDLSGTQISDLEPLRQLTQLQHLDLSGTEISDVDPLHNLTQLRNLDLAITQITDLTPLSQLTQLQELNLFNTGVSDVEPLRQLTQLQYLDLSRTQVTNVESLHQLTRLQYLDLFGTQVADLAALSQLTQLQYLDLFGTQVADVTPLRQLVQLEVLDLSRTRVEDVAPLDQLTRLRNLNLSGTLVTDVTPLRHLTRLSIVSR